MQDILYLKQLLHQLCRDFVIERIKTAETALEQARESGNDDTKSSAGDKYETGREMIQQEIDRNTKLLLDARANLNTLNLIGDMLQKDARADQPVAHTGSLVLTDNGCFYMSVSAGQLKVPEEVEVNMAAVFPGKPVFFAVSVTSPIGKQLLGKNEGTAFEINGNSYRIMRIF